MRSLLPGLVLGLALVSGTAALPPVLAQGTSGDLDATFSTDGGNEWWVEVDVDADEPLSTVEARVDGGEWRSLSESDWGAWAASFHVPDGSILTFQATSTEGEQATSQAYKWPSGEPATASAGELEAAFDTPGGNEWWIETYVQANQPITSVDARIDDGPWISLEHKPWDAWATSTHVPHGSTVTFQATSTEGQTATSQAYKWPSGEPATTTPSDGFEATFDTPGGNEWWIETYVQANQPITSVDARIDDGPWISLEHKPWDAWATSTHVPHGSILTFQATSTQGEQATSQGYRWPEGGLADEGPGEEPEATMDAAFAPKAGNAWWIETYVVAEEPIADVQARSADGSWHDMERADWGAWTASFHVPEDSSVEFRATDETGAVATSQAFTWPEAVPADQPDAAWPHEGSYAHYELYGGGPTAEYHYEIDAIFVYHDGEWIVRCDGYREDPGGREQVAELVTNDPPEGPSDPTVGEQVDIEHGGCGTATYNDLTVHEQRAYETRNEGDPVSPSTWYADRTADCNCLAWHGYWETETDLVTEWWRGGRTGDVGELQDTDAPMSEG